LGQPGMFVPEFEETMNQLAAMEAQRAYWFHVWRAPGSAARAPQSGAKPQRDACEFVRDTLRQTRAEEAYANWARDIRGRAFVELREPPL